MATSTASPVSLTAPKPIQSGPFTKSQFQHTIEGARNVKDSSEIEKLLRDYPAALELYRTGKYKVKVKCEADVERVILVEKRMSKNKSESSENHQMVPEMDTATKKDEEKTNPVPIEAHQAPKLKETLIHTASSSLRLTSNTQPKVDHYRHSSKERPTKKSVPVRLSNTPNFVWPTSRPVPPAYVPMTMSPLVNNGSFHGYLTPTTSFGNYPPPLTLPKAQPWSNFPSAHLHPALYLKAHGNHPSRARSVDPSARRDASIPMMPRTMMMATPYQVRPTPMSTGSTTSIPLSSMPAPLAIAPQGPSSSPGPMPISAFAPLPSKPTTNPEKLSTRQLHETFLQMNPTGRLPINVLPDVLKRFGIQTTVNDLISAAQDLQYNPHDPVSARRLIHMLVKLGRIAKSARPADQANAPAPAS